MISAPKSIAGLEVFSMFVDELGQETACKMLEVHRTTMRRWLRGAVPVPRMAVLALYWETKYGRSLIETDQVNEIRILYRQVKILEEQYLRAKEIVTGLRRLHTGTANEPLFEELPSLGMQHTEMAHYGPGIPTVEAALAQRR